MKTESKLNFGTHKIESKITSLNSRIEKLKVEYNLFFTGEINLPPEKERESIQKSIRQMINEEYRSAKINLLVQNVAATFNLYNNMWLKKLNDIETGVVIIKKKPSAFMPPSPPKSKDYSKDFTISLNDETSFEAVYELYEKTLTENKKKTPGKDQLINKLKLQLISDNMVEAQINLSTKEGKPSIKIKK